MKLPQFVPEPIKSPLENEAEGEIWQPDWRCYCCKDSGWITTPWLVELVVPNYTEGHDKRPACQRIGCAAGEYFQLDDRFDQRFTNDICQELHRLHIEDWKATIKANFELAKTKAHEKDTQEAQNVAERINTLADSLAMSGTRPRTGNDTREIEIKKENLEAVEKEKEEMTL